MSRKICVVTGSRAEYGLLRWVMKEIAAAPDFRLQVIATGMHLAPEFGLTYRDIESDGYKIDRKVDIALTSDSNEGVTRSMSLALVGVGAALAELKPDLLMVLGDRFEIFSAVAAALIARIPVAHLHGGEVTEGAFDESIRHSITKMSHLHFVAAEEYRDRVIQLGEPPERVFTVGSLGVDGIRNLELLNRESLEKSLDFKLGSKNLLITFHPVTLEPGESSQQMRELLEALDKLDDTHLIFTMPNADTEGRELMGMVRSFVATHPNSRVFESLGQFRYLSCIAHVDAVVGNSSSGLIEAPSLRKGTINIGNRQKGRLKAASVIDCEPERAAIDSALKRLYSAGFQTTLRGVQNPYGEGGAAKRISEILKTLSFDSLLRKHFHDIVSKTM